MTRPARVVYSVGARLPGGGIGNTSHHAVRGLHRNGMLERLICGSYHQMEIPSERIVAMGWLSRVPRRLAVYDKSLWVNYLNNRFYDIWASGRLVPGEFFHGWNGFSLKSIRKARSMGMRTIIERASSHPQASASLLRDEYDRWGFHFRSPAVAHHRAIAEIRESDYVAIPSDFVRASFLAQGESEGKLIQVPFGVDTTRFFPRVEKKSSRKFKALFVGRVGIRKGVPYLLDAWKRLGWHDAELLIVGNVDSNIQALLRQYNELPGLQLSDHVTDLVQLYRGSDVFVFPTIEEGSALVTYEALASGLPVITTPNAGSVVREGQEGFLVPIRDVDALAARLDLLRRDERLREEMGAAGRARAEEFTWQAYGDNLAEAILRKVPNA